MITEISKNKLTNVRNCVHPNCVVCSPSNTRGLQLKFNLCENGSVATGFQLDESLEGYPGIPHGGVISLIFDGAMGNCLFAHGLAAVTAELNIRFRHPIAMHQPATVTARIVQSSNSIYVLEAKITQGGQVKATAEGKFVDHPDLANGKEILCQPRRTNNNTG